MSQNCPLIALLTASPWPLSVCDIANTLEVDEGTAAMALKLLSEAGRASLTTNGKWLIR